MSSIPEWSRSDVLRVLRQHPFATSLDWDIIAEKFAFDLAVLDEPEGTLPIATLYGVFEYAAKELGNDAIMFDIFYATEVGTFSVFDYLFVCAPTVREACQAWKRFMPIRTNAFDVLFYEDTDFGTIEWPIKEGRGIWYQNEFARFGWAIKRLETVLETDTPPLTIHLAAPTPEGHSEVLERYAKRIRFNQLRNAISVPATLLSKPLPQNEDSLYAIIRQSALKEIEHFQNRHSPICKISDEIAETLKTGTCSLAQVAHNLGMSQRSVQRALEQEGTNFRKVTEDVRKTAAERYLRSTDLPLKEIAYLLGFSELSTFSRAVKTWFGVPPREIR